MKELWWKIVIWWQSGGGMPSGYDADGERMETLSNGEMLMLCVGMALGFVGLAALIMLGIKLKG